MFPWEEGLPRLIGTQRAQEADINCQCPARDGLEQEDSKEAARDLKAEPDTEVGGGVGVEWGPDWKLDRTEE